MSNKNRIKTYFGSQTSDDYELAGVYPIVLENTQSLIENNNIQGKGAIALNYNSQLVVEDLKCDNKDYIIKAIIKIVKSVSPDSSTTVINFSYTNIF